MADQKPPSTTKKKRPTPPKFTPTRKPDGVSLEEWQTQLRRQFGREQKFKARNVGDGLAFSDFAVTNPKSGNTYRVRIRGPHPGDNGCTCPDFATNTLGTCKHIEFVLAKLERGRESRRELRGVYEPAVGEVFLRYGSRREVCYAPPADAPAPLRKLAAKFFDPTGRMRDGVASRFAEFHEAASEHDPDMAVGDGVMEFLAEQTDGERRAATVAELFPAGVRSPALDGLLKVPLYDYQREGVLFATRAGRCLIGDEMGLGKTAMAIATAEAMARHFGVERVLVVCPTSLKHQWNGEITRFTDRAVRVVDGEKPRRSAAFADPVPFFKITNYDTVHADLPEIEAWAPDLVILDEAQRIKNWTTRVARSVKKVKSPYAVVLTGTPLENRLEELISIVQFVDPHRLGPTFRLLHDHQVRDEVGKVTGYRDLGRIGQTLAPILLRRTKQQVLSQLPERIKSTVFVPMTPKQQVLHTENQELVARIVQKWRRFGFLTERDKQRLMVGLQNMRMACDSSYLLDSATDHGLKVSEIDTVLGELLEDPSTKVVVFSQWLRMHELLAKAAEARGWGHVLFHGGVESRKRGKLIEQFRTDADCRLFLSTDAGGVGLNLQFASVVLNVDLPWNPAVLEQRIGRVHRMGQRQPVRVVNFVAKGTIEEGMLGVLKFKKSLFAGVLDGGASDIDFGGTRLKKFLESVEEVTGQIPTAQVAESQEAAEAKREFAEEPTAAKEGDADESRSPAPGGDPWAALLQAGAAVLGQLAAPTPAGATRDSFVRTDDATGETYLRLPVPSPELLTQAVSALTALLAGLKKG